MSAEFQTCDCEHAHVVGNQISADDAPNYMVVYRGQVIGFSDLLSEAENACNAYNVQAGVIERSMASVSRTKWSETVSKADAYRARRAMGTHVYKFVGSILNPGFGHVLVWQANSPIDSRVIEIRCEAAWFWAPRKSPMSNPFVGHYVC